MFGLHEGCTGRKPPELMVQKYRRDVKRVIWDLMVEDMERTCKSISRNYNLRHSGQALGENESSKLYLFGKYLCFSSNYLPAMPWLLEYIGFSE